jgi:uncharacterized protein (TIGR02145 family)
MKKETFFGQIKGKIHLLFVMLFLSIVPSCLLNAQGYVDEGGLGFTIAYPDSTRLLATILEREDTVELQLMLVGPVHAATLVWDLVYDMDNLQLVDRNFADVTNNFDAHATGFFDLNPNLPPGFISAATTHYELAGSSSGLRSLECGIAQIGMNGSRFVHTTRDIYYLTSIYFRKINPNAPLLSTDLGFYWDVWNVFDSPMMSSAIGGQSSYIAPNPVYVTQSRLYGTSTFLGEEMFTYRSPSWVVTDSATNIQETQADLIGNFSRGDLAAGSMINSEFNRYDMSGRLNYDDVTLAGFIYTKEDVAITPNPYTRTMTVNGTDYPFPDAEELAAQTFERGGVTFFIASNTVTDPAKDVVLNSTVAGLEAGETYYAWAFIDYHFETSLPYINMGERIKFQTVRGAGDEFEILCADDTLILLPYGVSPESIQLNQPEIMEMGVVVSDSIRNADYAISNDFSAIGNGVFTVTWSVYSLIHDTTLTCEQLVVINFEPCGNNDIEYFADGTSAPRLPFYANDCDLNQYSTVRIGYECWTAENMVAKSDSNCVSANYAAYEASMYPDPTVNADKYGYLYDAGTAMSICPEGWVLPTVAQYETLIPYGSDALRKQNEWLQDNTATNSTGFTALPAGYYQNSSDMYVQLLGDTYFWTSASTASGVGQVAHIRYLCPVLQIEPMAAVNAASVRCVKIQSTPAIP